MFSQQNTVDRQVKDFLPNHLAITQTPPHPAAKVTAAIICLLFSIAIIWAMVSEVDIIVSASGKLIPTGQSKQIQPLSKSIIKQIHVADGDAVKAGDILVELDADITLSDINKLTNDLMICEIKIANLQAFDQSLKQGQLQPVQYSRTAPVEHLNPLLAKEQALHHVIFQQQWQSFQAETALLRLQAQELEAKADINAIEIEKYQSLIAFTGKKVKGLKKLLARDMVAEVEYLEQRQNQINLQKDLAIARSRAKEIQAQIHATHQRIDIITSDISFANLQVLAEEQQRAFTLQQEINKAQSLDSQHTLRAPVDGIVQGLAISGIGQVVTDAQVLMNIIPSNQQVEVEAWLENKDIGFIHQGQNAEVKINTFLFTKYGVIDGAIKLLSSDAIIDEQKGLLYKTLISLSAHSMQIDGKDVSLLPGMEVVAEIKTGKRKVIEYILSPLLRYKSESIRER